VTAPAISPPTRRPPGPCGAHVGDSIVCSWCLERLHDEIDLLSAAVEAIRAARDTHRTDPSAEAAWDVVYARLEVAGDAVVRASSKLAGRPAVALVTRSTLDPVEEGGPVGTVNGGGPPR